MSALLPFPIPRSLGRPRCAGADLPDRTEGRPGNDRQRQWHGSSPRMPSSPGRRNTGSTALHHPGKPMQNGYVESFNGMQRTSLLNETLILHARPGPPDDRCVGSRTTTPKGRTHRWPTRHLRHSREARRNRLSCYAPPGLRMPTCCSTRPQGIKQARSPKAADENSVAGHFTPRKFTADVQ